MHHSSKTMPDKISSMPRPDEAEYITGVNLVADGGLLAQGPQV